jgi:hypothetical protein
MRVTALDEPAEVSRVHFRLGALWVYLAQQFPDFIGELVASDCFVRA